MKITGTKYAKMHAGMRAAVDYAGGPAAVKAAYAAVTPGRMLWDLWHSVSRCLLYDDAHPGFARGLWPRFIPHDPSFDIYSDDANDSHILTALKKIGREFGLLV